MSSAHTNRLAHAKSPYLLQHAHNPVDWFPWGDEAFAKARAENKPIFLSIGYSTCHWCHVMERESFESERIAARLNAHFLSIKVDREERPDVDKIYMTFVQATTGSGGWPLNVFLTPERKPFYGGTYFPPEERHGRASFARILDQVAAFWQERREEIETSAEAMCARLEAAITGSLAAGEGRGSVETLRHAGDAFKAAYDARHGGFGGEPKFPQPSLPAFLLRHAKRFGDDEAARMVLHTCERMAAGGIHDQLGGGFARYSVDAQWLVPHFEKMLYDQAQLAQLYLDAALLAKSEVRSPKSEDFAQVARDILDYVLRDLTHPEGGFYSAEDADSEGHEGKFYCWTKDELSRLLTVEEYTVAARHFGISAEGNFVDHSHPSPLPGQNVLSIVESVVRAEDRSLLAEAMRKMREARAQRVRPLRDDKILTSWNGLMLGAFARAYAVLRDEKYLTAAEKNLGFLQANLWEVPKSGIQRGTLYHRWREGERDQAQLLEDYACLLDGVLHLYEAALNLRHLEFAIALAEAMIARFYDPAKGGFWQSAEGADDLILRVKDDYDGAEPSGNSVATLALLKLAAITGAERFRNPAEATLRLFGGRLRTTPHAVPWMLHALDFWLEAPRRVAIAGDPASAEARRLLRAAHAVFQPNKVVLGNAGPVEPFVQTLRANEGALAYVCTGTACLPPTNDPVQLASLLS